MASLVLVVDGADAAMFAFVAGPEPHLSEAAGHLDDVSRLGIREECLLEFVLLLFMEVVSGRGEEAGFYELDHRPLSTSA